MTTDHPDTLGAPVRDVVSLDTWQGLLRRSQRCAASHPVLRYPCSLPVRHTASHAHYSNAGEVLAVWGGDDLESERTA